MTRHPFWIGMLVWVAGFVGSLSVGAQDLEIVLLHTNDWHGQIRPRVLATEGGSVPTGGGVALARAIDEQRARHPNTLLLSAGDWFQGTPEGVGPDGRLMIDLMDRLGYDAAAVGNHDFDLGQGTLESLARQASFPCLGANIVKAETMERPAYLRDFVILDVAGVRVGIGGLLTDDAGEIIMKSHTRGLRFLSQVDTARQLAKSLSDAGADVLVLLNHIPATANRVIAEAVPDFDVIIGGHDHGQSLQQGTRVGKTVIAQARSHALGLGAVTIRWDRSKAAVSDTTAAIIELPYDPEATHPDVQAVLEKYKVSTAYDEPIDVLAQVHIPNSLTRTYSRHHSSSLGNWVTDAMRDRAGTEIAFQNKGGLRKDLVAGQVTVRDFFELAPFRNNLVKVTLSGAQVLELLTAALDEEQSHSGLEISGLSVLLDGRLAPFESSELEVLVGEEALDPNRDYSVVTNSFLIEGGDGYTTFTRGRDIEYMEVLLREAQMSYAQKQGVLAPTSGRRWTYLPVPPPRNLSTNLGRGALGLISLLALAVLMSNNRKRIPWRLVFGALAMQLVLGLFLIEWDIGFGLFESLSRGVSHLLGFSDQGATFVFGKLATGDDNAPGLAFRALPTIIFFSCLMAILYHLRIMHLLIWCLAKIMSRLLGVTGAESMAVAANVFVGQTEAPLVVRKYLPKLTKSELSSLMTGGFATVAGSVLAAYISFYDQVGGSEYVPHLLIASVMSAPAAFAISKIIVPETATSETGADMALEFQAHAGNVLEAAATGVTEGLKLWLNVCAMLLAFVAVVALVDWPLQSLGQMLELDGGLSLSRIFGWVFSPIAWLMGVEYQDSSRFGALLGTKVGINEFLAYLELQKEIVYANNPEAMAAAGVERPLSRRTVFMATYALCGFANFSSIGIQIGGIAPLVPERRKDIIDLALKAMIGGALASWMTATIAGMFF